MKDSTKRFSDRVDDYTKYRPSYPQEAVNYILNVGNVADTSRIADIGSGTGKFTELLLKKCEKVYGVEPNAEMRLAAENLLKCYRSFVSINATAENTTLDDKSIDCITTAQAFHWFDIKKVKTEFMRILKENKYVFIIWNKRYKNTNFMVSYEKLLNSTASEYRKVNYSNITSEIIRDFIPINYNIKKFTNNQLFNWTMLVGRFRSSSYVPIQNPKEYNELEKKLKILFDKYAQDGQVTFNYETEVYSGKIA